VLFSPAELAKPDFSASNASLTWALSGFSNSTVWLIFSAFMFAVAYEKTGLGRRLALRLVAALGRNTLTLGYAVLAADLVLAPFTPSNTATRPSVAEAGPWTAEASTRSTRRTFTPSQYSFTARP
jgi:L-tartrate/succinate antiporter